MVIVRSLRRSVSRSDLSRVLLLFPSSLRRFRGERVRRDRPPLGPCDVYAMKDERLLERGRLNARRPRRLLLRVASPSDSSGGRILRIYDSTDACPRRLRLQLGRCCSGRRYTSTEGSYEPRISSSGTTTERFCPVVFAGHRVASYSPVGRKMVARTSS